MKSVLSNINQETSGLCSKVPQIECRLALDQLCACEHLEENNILKENAIDKFHSPGLEGDQQSLFLFSVC
jgi:hypothetical protein